MNPTIVVFLATGIAFGLVTYPNRHFFSEGGARPQGAGGVLESRLLWCAICSCLWPIFAATGAWNLVRLALKEARSKGAR
ncbi:MAG: hypothetical protein ING59_08830 [Burkholderiales bacterium]|jgi:hypothetical protein|nr:hypothetical protein [Burkholderiales bacterium]